MAKNMTPAQYKRRRFIFFWLSAFFAIVPSIVVTAALLPFMRIDTGIKWGIGAAIVALNLIFLAGNILHSIFTHLPTFNWIAFILALAGSFFSSPVFADYASTFNVINWTTALSGAISCVFIFLHNKYKSKDQQAKTMKELGVI